MTDVTYKLEDGVLILSLAGRIDSSNAGETEAAIAQIRSEAPAESVVIDCDKLAYISSAGLRVILRLRKAVPDIKLLNVTPEVYEVFEMTGFVEMMEVQKAYRVISVEGCEVIGSGANGKVYRIDPETIVKAYRHADSLPEIQRERELARTAFVLGIPTAIPYDVVRIESGGYGSVFELLNATNFATLLSTGQKTIDEAAQMSVDLLKLIHSTVVKPDSMPDMRTVALGWADFLREYLPSDQAVKLYSLVEAVPVDYHMIHGDYHIKNIMLQNGEILLIDMDTLSHGHPIFEFASMFNAYIGFGETNPVDAGSFLGFPFSEANAFWRKCLHLYFDGEGEAFINAVEEKARILGYARIMRRSIRRGGLESESGRRVIENCKTRLAELLPRVDTLLF